MCHHHTNGTVPFALHTDAVRRNVGFAMIEIRAHHFHQQIFIDRASAELEIDEDMIGDRSRFGERFDVGWICIDGRSKLRHVF